MTSNPVAFNVITTLYLVIGFLLKEKRLKEAYGQAYVDYQEIGVNFFIPSVNHLISLVTQHLDKTGTIL